MLILAYKQISMHGIIVSLLWNHLIWLTFGGKEIQSKLNQNYFPGHQTSPPVSTVDLIFFLISRALTINVTESGFKPGIQSDHNFVILCIQLSSIK